MSQSENTAKTGGDLTAGHMNELSAAVELLENPNFASRLADYAGQPVNVIIDHLPRTINRRLRDAVRIAIFKCLELAINSIDDEDTLAPAEWTAKVLTGVAGGIGGFFGMAGLPIELPITTTLMLRSIAEIARSEGEDLRQAATLLACLEVFALGVRGPHDNSSVDYYAARMVLTKLTGEVSALLLERGAINASSPIVAKLVGEIVARFGLVVSDMAAASAVPIFGAVGGATVNMIFMNHFQRVARGHFTVRRLERIYGAEIIEKHYRQKAQPISLARVRLPARKKLPAR